MDSPVTSIRVGALEDGLQRTTPFLSTNPIPDDQFWFHHPEMQNRIRRAEEELASGRFTRTETPAEAQAFLDSLKKKPRQRR